MGETTRDQVEAVYREMLGDKPWDDLTSLDKMTLFISLEDEFGKTIDQSEVQDINSFEEMVDTVERLL
jgi:acyl carrier protein